MKYIESLREGEKVNEVYLCKFKQAALTKAGKAYDNVILQDKTGTIDAKIWDPGSVGIDEFDALDYVAVTGGGHRPLQMICNVCGANAPRSTTMIHDSLLFCLPPIPHC